MMEETRKLPTVTGRKGPLPTKRKNTNIPSIKEMHDGGVVCKYSGEGAGDLLFLPIGKSRPMLDTSKLAKEWANS